MDENTTKMLSFINHMMKNDNIKNEPPLIAETLIINFISKNMAVLKQTLASPQFFPDLSIEQTLELLLTTLREKVLKEVKPALIKYIDSVNFNVLNDISGSETITPESLKEKLTQFLDVILTHKEVRYNFNSIANIFAYDGIGKYIGEIFTRKEFIYNELIKVQKNNLKEEQYINYLKILLLLKNTAYIKMPFTLGNETKNLNIIDIQKAPTVMDKYIASVENFLSKPLPGLDKKMIKMAIKSNCPQELTELEEASSRLLYALCGRYQEYKHFDKIDRGAESPDKSWFNIVKKNAEDQGFDKKIIEELYKIAADNNW